MVLRLQCVFDEPRLITARRNFGVARSDARAKNNPEVTDDITTRPMLEALLEGQRQLGSQMAELRDALAAISRKQDEFAAKQDQLDARVTALTREVRNGFDDYNRKINALNQRLLSFETWLSRIDDRLHEEIIARTR